MTINMELHGSEDLKRTLTAVERSVFPKANARALNKTIMKMRTDTVRRLAKSMGLKQKDVRDRVRLFKANPQKQTARIDYEGKAFNLIRFKARQFKAGVKARPWGQAKTYPRSFIARIQGNDVVMIRQERGGQLVPRLPIRPMLGPGIAKSAAEPHIDATREDVVRTVYRPELERQLEMMVKRLTR